MSVTSNYDCSQSMEKLSLNQTRDCLSFLIQTRVCVYKIFVT